MSIYNKEDLEEMEELMDSSEAWFMIGYLED